MPPPPPPPLPGTDDYLDPLYAQLHQLTDKSDVYGLVGLRGLRVWGLGSGSCMSG